MSKLAPAADQLIKLLLRSPDVGDGWRTVSTTLQSLVLQVVEKEPDLFQIEQEPSFRVRLTPQGQTVGKYM